MNRFTQLISMVLAVTLGALTLGCENEQDRLDAIVAAVPTSTRATTAASLKTDFDAGKITFESSLIRAEEMLESGHVDSVAFAGAVLDFAVQIEDKLPKGAEFELFWRRIGRLAYNSSYAAYERQDFQAIGSLILAGPKRWQRETYWITYPNHEILLAFSKAYQGDANAGIRLLSSRAPMPDGYQEAIDSLKEIGRQQLRQRLREGIEEQEFDQGG
ncbi:MAG: hypothetical protein ACIARQ_04830 [Phycisphaerales bacterium JB061]